VGEGISRPKLHFERNAALCQRCKGAGYYLLDVPVSSPQFGVLQLCACKRKEQSQRRSAELRQLSNLQAFETKTFATFNFQIAGVAKAFSAAKQFTQQPEGWFILTGGTGSGKTHLAAAIAHEILSQGKEVLFTVVPDLLDHLRSTFSPSSSITYDKRFDAIREISLLILDDLGTEYTTPWALEKLYQIINHRYNYQLPTVITTNCLPEELDQRIVSRMFDYKVAQSFLLTAPDYRSPLTERLGKRNRW